MTKSIGDQQQSWIRVNFWQAGFLTLASLVLGGLLGSLLNWPL